MGLKVIADNLDDIDAKYHDLYVADGDKFRLTGIEGMRTQVDIDRLQNALVKERNDHKQSKEKFSLLGDRKIEDVVASLDRIPELEAAATGKIDETKLNEIVEGRLRSKISPLERENAQLKTGLKEREDLIGQFKSKELTRAIHDSVREAVGKFEGFQAGAVDDAMLYAERMLTVDEAGRVVTKDDVGVTPGVDAFVWLNEMQPKKAHWWGTSQGGGANGNRTGAGTTTNPWSHDGWNMTEQGKLLTENRARAEQLAKSAGTQIGGARPAKK